MAKLIVTIDGPAASGKSTIAKKLAKKLNAAFLDTGAMYRTVTLAAIEAKIDLKIEEQLMAMLSENKLEFKEINDSFDPYLNGECVSQKIRGKNVTKNICHVAKMPKVRQFLIKMQKEFVAKNEKIVTEGRDQGSVVFTKANFKFYLTATAAERAKRRQKQLNEKGVKADFDELKKDIEKRDESDKNRTIGTLKVAENATVIDSTNMTIDQCVAELFKVITE